MRERGALNLKEMKSGEDFVIFFSRSKAKGTTYHKLVSLAMQNGGNLDGMEVEVLTGNSEMNGNAYTTYVFPCLYDEGDDIVQPGM